MTTQPKQSFWSFNILNIEGVPVRLHFSFVVLLLWPLIGLSSKVELTALGPWFDALFVISSVFLSVLLHELAHILFALQVGASIKEVLLFPIGGKTVTFETLTTKKELLVSCAGPFASLLIALALGSSSLSVFPNQSQVASLQLNPIGFFALVNATIFLVNLIPMAPFDGDRILKALAGLLYGDSRGVVYATRSAQILSLLLILTGTLESNLLLFVLGSLLLVSSTQEHVFYKAKFASIGHKAQSIMLPLSRLDFLKHGTDLEQAMKTCLKSLQSHFPVMHGDEILGIVNKKDLLHASILQNDSSYIGSVMNRDYAKCQFDDPLEQCIDQIKSRDAGPLLVFDKNALVGLIPKEKLFEAAIVFESLRKGQI